VTLAAANTFPIGYYTNFRPNGMRKALPDLPVIGALATPASPGRRGRRW
jgi:phospholipase C